MLYLYCRLATAGQRNDRGASAVEYGLLVAIVAAACISAWEAVGATVPWYFEHTTASTEVTYGSTP